MGGGVCFLRFKVYLVVNRVWFEVTKPTSHRYDDVIRHIGFKRSFFFFFAWRRLVKFPNHTLFLYYRQTF